MSKGDTSEISVKNVPTTLKEELHNISVNLGVDLGALIKLKLREIANTYPEHMKRKKA